MPQLLGDLAMKMLVKDPTRRLQNAEAVHTELGHLLTAVPLARSPELVTERLTAPRPPKARPGFYFGLAGALVALIIASMTTTLPRTWMALLCTATAGHLACATVTIRSDQDFIDQCPAEARATTADLQLSQNKNYEAVLQQWPGKDKRPLETPLLITPGPVIAEVDTSSSDVNPELRGLMGALLYGQARFFAKDRISIQYDRIMLKNGAVLPLCAVAYTFQATEFGPGIQQFPDPGVPPPTPEQANALKAFHPGEMPFAIPRHYFRIR